MDNHLLLILDGEIGGVDSGHCLWSFDTVNMLAQIAYDPWQGIGNNSQSGTYGDLQISEDGHYLLQMTALLVMNYTFGVLKVLETMAYLVIYCLSTQYGQD